jgi:hypothetical protein
MGENGPEDDRRKNEYIDTDQENYSRHCVSFLSKRRARPQSRRTVFWRLGDLTFREDDEDIAPR